jgi:2-polyprenyl-6-methoxyphenol hydroxylase-like FAD-dependent oxidoreductase
MRSKKRALIIGCGIAGPAAAIFLKRAGCDPVIYEAMPEHDDYAGLFLNVGRNGMRILKELGIDGLIRREGFGNANHELSKRQWQTVGPSGPTIRRAPRIHGQKRISAQRAA